MTTLQAVRRTKFSRSAKKAIRDSGQIPAIIYGKAIQSEPIAVDSIQLMKTLRDEGKNTIIKIDIEETSHNVMLYDMQTDSLKANIIHADFHVVNMKEDVEVEVPLQLVGEAQGVKDGGVLQQSVHEITVKDRPGNIPQTIDVDISNLAVNETIQLKDINRTGNFQFVQEEDLVIASILPPKQEEEIDSGEEQEPGTPENEEGREE
ncbi:50S ribosomal protein L25/general stress protein Ctc [Metabacillus malikii]|uniref:Large ribosomal subunit protein bL25 n=1 Tax=Metabacillus malikii TaxID=1504265 RepID=A0ABT9ZM27_9BACI|nr:50S ribosomal protein L25/general stress protein Ctc [Metabacillus malikii]MDQ0233350.1 large subunit ribosomal protein L25 [Metabacillus malikii]